MEVEKRKRIEDRKEADRKKAKIVEGKRDQKTASSALNGADHRGDDDGADGEVEEFYAILRRIHVAVQYFENGKGARKKKTNSTATAKAKATVTATSWSPNFRREDFEGGCSNGVKEGDTTVTADSASLDLNVEPDPESD